MNPLETLIRALMQQAPQRPDLLSEAQGGPSFGSPDYRPTGQRATATFAGRVVQPGETPQDVLKRMPMGSGEGDIGSALQATVAQAAPFLAKAGAMKILASLMPAMRGYHGTPTAPEGELNPNYTGSSSSGVVGPGLYVSNNPTVTSGLLGEGKPPTYAWGATSGIKGPTTMEQALDYIRSGNARVSPNYAPQTHAFQLAEHESFPTHLPISQAEIDRLAAAAGQVAGEGRKASNAMATVRSNSGELGQKVWQSLADFMGPAKANQALRNAGYKSIAYEGGNLVGDIPHQALNVLDPSIMQNLFDALAGKPKP